MKLTPNQHKAVYTPNNILVEAGAGSGKTSVFVERYCHLLTANPHWSANQIVAISFTTLSAKELQERLLKKMGYRNDIKEAPITTIHGFCSTLIRKFPIEAQVDPAFTVLQQDEANFMIQEAVNQTIQSLASTHNPSLRALLFKIKLHTLKTQLVSACQKKELLTPHMGIPHEHPFIEDLKVVIEETWQHYMSKKKEKGALDYSDLIQGALKVLQNDHSRSSCQKYYKAIMVDEFQDTDSLQWTIIQALCQENSYIKDPKLFLVGDVKQSIYSFRGAEPHLFSEIMAEFKTHPKSCSVISLQENFRTQPQIIQTTNTLFKALMDQEKHPYSPLKATRNQEKSQVLALHYTQKQSKEEECQNVALKIESLLQETPSLRPKDIAIICRKRSNFGLYQTALNTLNIPNKVEKPTGFYRQQIILDSIALIKALMSPFDTLAWIHVLSSPIGRLPVEEILELQFQNPKASIPYLLEHSPNKDHQKLGKELKRWQAETFNSMISPLLTQILTERNAWSYYANGPQGRHQIEALSLFITLTQRLEENCHGNRHQFITELRYKVDNNESPSQESSDENAVSIMTIHAAKGLEFPVVILPELYQEFRISRPDPIMFHTKDILVSNLIYKDPTPENNPILDEIQKEAKEEEKRLLYVAFTRARDLLILSGIDKDMPVEKETSFAAYIAPFLANEALFKIEESKDCCERPTFGSAAWPK